MKKFIYLIIIFLFYSCGENIEKENLKDITITTKSDEARKLLLEALNADQQNRTNLVPDILKSAIAKDPDFVLAKALLNSGFIRPQSSVNIRILSDIYNNSLDKVSEMEAMLIKTYYYAATREFDMATGTLDEMTIKYPDISRIWQYSGVIKSYIGDVYEATDDLEACLELDPNNFAANAFLMAKHIVVGNLGNMLPVEERDLDEAKSYIDRMIEINPNNPYGYTMAGNYERSNNNFEKANEYYKQVADIPSEDNSTIYASNHYQALTNTFLKKYDLAEKFFNTNIEIASQGYKTQALGFMGNLHVFSGDFNRAIDALDFFIEVMPTLEFPYVRENSSLANIHFNKFLCYAHNQQENESLEEINLFSNYINNVLEYRKSSYTETQFKSIKLRNDNQISTLRVWHDILFGRYEGARRRLENVKIYADEQIKFNPESYYDFNAFSGMIYLNEGDFEKAIESFSKNQSLEIAGALGMDGDYFDYFYALALKGGGRADDANVILKRVSSNNFYGYGRGLVRNLALNQL